MTSARRSLLASAIVALTLHATRPAAGEGSAARAGDHVLFVRGSSVLAVQVEGSSRQPVEVAKLPDPHGLVHRLQGSRTGEVLLLTAAEDAGPRDYWVALRRGTTPEARSVACDGSAGLSPNGRCLVCATSKGGTRVVRLRSGRSRSYALSSDTVRFLGPSGRELIAWDQAGIWAIPLRRSAKKRQLAPHVPAGALWASPDGKRAVGVYSAGDAATLETFRLDGRAARRTLLRDGEPVAWSADSAWLLANQEERACIVRAVGGEYKCWRGYTGAAIAPDGSYAILAKPTEPPGRDAKSAHAGAARAAPADPRPVQYDLYRADLAGASNGRPVLLAERTSSPAALLMTFAVRD